MNDALFEKRKAAALRLRECIRDKGYTKVSFAKRADVSRQVLDELLDGVAHIYCFSAYQPMVRVHFVHPAIELTQERRCPIWIKSKLENS